MHQTIHLYALWVACLRHVGQLVRRLVVPRPRSSAPNSPPLAARGTPAGSDTGPLRGHGSRRLESSLDLRAYQPAAKVEPTWPIHPMF